LVAVFRELFDGASWSQLAERYPPARG